MNLTTSIQEHLQGITNYMAQSGDLVQAKVKALILPQGLLEQQATLMAYIDNFRLLGMRSMLCIPGILMLRKRRGPSAAVPMH